MAHGCHCGLFVGEFSFVSDRATKLNLFCLQAELKVNTKIKMSLNAAVKAGVKHQFIQKSNEYVEYAKPLIY